MFPWKCSNHNTFLRKNLWYTWSFPHAKHQHLKFNSFLWNTRVFQFSRCKISRFCMEHSNTWNLQPGNQGRRGVHLWNSWLTSCFPWKWSKHKTFYVKTCDIPEVFLTFLWNTRVFQFSRWKISRFCMECSNTWSPQPGNQSRRDVHLWNSWFTPCFHENVQTTTRFYVKTCDIPEVFRTQNISTWSLTRSFGTRGCSSFRAGGVSRFCTSKLLFYVKSSSRKTGVPEVSTFCFVTRRYAGLPLEDVTFLWVNIETPEVLSPKVA